MGFQPQRTKLWASLLAVALRQSLRKTLISPKTCFFNACPKLYQPVTTSVPFQRVWLMIPPVETHSNKALRVCVKADPLLEQTLNQALRLALWTRKCLQSPCPPSHQPSHGASSMPAPQRVMKIYFYSPLNCPGKSPLTLSWHLWRKLNIALSAALHLRHHQVALPLLPLSPPRQHPPGPSLTPLQIQHL